jgi:hypothetical protein
MHYFRSFLIFTFHVQHCPHNRNLKEIKHKPSEHLPKNKPDDRTCINNQV